MLPTGLGADIFKDKAESRLTRGIRISSAQDYGGPVLWQKQLLDRGGHGFVTSSQRRSLKSLLLHDLTVNPSPVQLQMPQAHLAINTKHQWAAFLP